MSNKPATPNEQAAEPLPQATGSAFKRLTMLAFAATLAGVITSMSGNWKADAAAWNLAALFLWMRGMTREPNTPAHRPGATTQTI